MIHDFLTWLAATPWSVQLLESQYAWPFIESTHVLTLALFAGTAAINDLRLLGVGFTAVPAGEVVLLHHEHETRVHVFPPRRSIPLPLTAAGAAA